MTETVSIPERRFGIYCLISPGAEASEHTLRLELRRSTLIRFATGSEDEAVDVMRGYVDRHPVHLIELGGGWSFLGVEKLLDAVADRTIVTTRWFPEGELPETASGKIRRGVLFFCSTPDTRAFLETPRDQIWFEGVLDTDQAVEACSRLSRDHGIQVLEVCSDWGFLGGAQAQRAAGPQVKVGVSLHQASDSARRAQQLYVPKQFLEEGTAVAQ